MEISKNGLDLIKQHAECRLESYKRGCYHYIGYTKMYNKSTAGVVITQEEADQLLLNGIKRFTIYVNKLHYRLNQNQFDALVSFAYDMGVEMLDKLTAHEFRGIRQISEAFLDFNNIEIREKEKKLFDEPIIHDHATENIKLLQTALNDSYNCKLKIDGKIMSKTGNILKKNILWYDIENAHVKFVQERLVKKGYPVKIDGVFGDNMEQTIRDFQRDCNILIDGKCGYDTISMLI